MTDQKLFKVILHEHQIYIDNAMLELKSERIVERIWEKDFTVWSDKPTEITNRLGWLKSPAASLEMADEIIEFVELARKDGFKKVLLLGMGGSSLAPEVFSKTFGTKEGFLYLEIVDSTHPEAIIDYAERFEPVDTLYIVSTKSGGTVETFSFMKYFFNQALKKVGKENVGKHFVAITDPGSGLETIGKQLGFRKIFLNDPNIGGRYAALSLFGIVPAALIGIDIKKLLNNAESIVKNSCGVNSIINDDNTSAVLGVILGTLAEKGRDKISFITSEQLSYFGNWVEQLIAESTGKEGKGILPVVGEEVLKPDNYYNDRYFIYLRLEDDHSKDSSVKELINAKHPVVEIVLNDVYELGGEFFRWEMATILAGWKLEIQPFDQPNVESAKILSRKFLAQYEKEGTLPHVKHNFEFENVKVYANDNSDSIENIVKKYFGNDDKEFRDKENEYISIQAYLKPESKTDALLHKLQTLLQTRYKSAVTVGYGPRFLHSTGQLHKGDAGKGMFIQFISESKNDIPIPQNPGEEKSIMTFGTLIKAQAFGDRGALIDGKRNVISFMFDEADVEKSLNEIINKFN